MIFSHLGAQEATSDLGAQEAQWLRFKNVSFNFGNIENVSCAKIMTCVLVGRKLFHKITRFKLF